MPCRKMPPSLEVQCLRQIGGIFRAIFQKVSEESGNLKQSDSASYQEESYMPCPYFHRGSSADVLQSVISLMQEMFLEKTSCCFHRNIASEFLTTLSDLFVRTRQLHRSSEAQPLSSSCSSASSSSRGGAHGGGDRRERSRRKKLIKEERLLAFLTFFCHDTTKEIDLSREVLGPHSYLHWRIVARLCSLLPHMPSLEVLHLANWSCKHFSLLADHNQREGWQLAFLTKLKRISVSQVSLDFFQNIGSCCMNLKQLQVFSSDISDAALEWAAQCKNLELVELRDNRAVTPAGFAKLLRSNPNLKSLGRCDVIGQVLTALFSGERLARRGSWRLPANLKLEEIDSEQKLSPSELTLMVRHCPLIQRLRICYLPTDSDDHNISSSFEHRHLSSLCDLRGLTCVCLTDCDFYGHLLFILIEERGESLLRLELRNVDEMNLNSLLLVGRRCKELRRLSLLRCHWQVHPDDLARVDEICKQDDDDLFQTLTHANFCLNSHTHVLFAKLVIVHARSLYSLVYNELSYDLDDSFLWSIFSWNKMSELGEFEVGPRGASAKLTTCAVNLIVERCPKLRRLARVRDWGGVTEEQVRNLEEEIRRRNLDLCVDL